MAIRQPLRQQRRGGHDVGLRAIDDLLTAVAGSLRCLRQQIGEAATAIAQTHDAKRRRLVLMRILADIRRLMYPATGAVGDRFQAAGRQVGKACIRIGEVARKCGAMRAQIDFVGLY